MYVMKMQLFKKDIILFIFLCLFFIPFVYPQGDTLGTDSLIDAQIGGPNPLFSIGHNIQKKGHGMVRNMSFYEYRDEGKSSLTTHNGVYYAPTETLTVNIRVPVVMLPKTEGKRSTGVGNIHLQAEWACYNHLDKKGCLSQVTLLGTVRIPGSGSNLTVIDIDTVNAPNAIMGFTTANWSNTWHNYSDFGVNLIATRHHFKLGNQFFFNLGLGRILFSKQLRKGLLYLELLVDMNGTYRRPNLMYNKPDYISGGTITYLGPTFRFSVPSFVFLGGLQYPILQVHRNPAAIRSHYKWGLGAAWVF